MNILIVEDETELRESMKQFFISEGCSVTTAGNKFVAEDQLILDSFDVVVLDIGLPDGSGLDLIKVIKSNKKEDTNIVILSAKNSLEDKLLGLDLGADDYLTKPFHISELNARIKAISRRRGNNINDIINLNEITINLPEQQVYINDKAMTLTQKEYQLLLYFISNQRRVLTKESISNHLWENQADLMSSYDLIYTHIKNLRKKILDLGGKDYLKSVYGIGYKFIAE